MSLYSVNTSIQFYANNFLLGSVSVSVSESVNKSLKFNTVSVVKVTLKDIIGPQPIHHVLWPVPGHSVNTTCCHRTQF